MGRGLDTLELEGLTLEGVTRGGVETCLMVPELRLMFDVGMCPPGSLAFPRVLISHGHADHISGLRYLIAQRGLTGQKALHAHYPAEIDRALRTILEAWAEIEDFDLMALVELHPQRPGDRFVVGKEYEAQAIRSVHRVPSLCYRVDRVSRPLKEEFRGLPKDEIVRLKKEGVELTQRRETPLLAVTGDTQIELLSDPELHQVRTLVVEVTAWDERMDLQRCREWGHTHVEELISLLQQGEANGLGCRDLVLVHRSMRHKKKQAQAIVRERFPKQWRDKVHVFGN